MEKIDYSKYIHFKLDDKNIIQIIIEYKLIHCVLCISKALPVDNYWIRFGTISLI